MSSKDALCTHNRRRARALGDEVGVYFAAPSARHMPVEMGTFGPGLRVVLEHDAGSMSDERLRQLERRWKETGSAEDEAVFLLARVRAGELTRERLELAAFCGSPGALRAAPQVVEKPSEDLGRLLEAVEESWGTLPAIGSGVAAARAAVDSCLKSGHPRAVLPTALVDVAEAAFKCPCRAHSEAAWDTYRRFSAEFWRVTEGQDVSVRSAQSAALACARAAAGRHHAARKAVDDAAAAAGSHVVRAAILRYLLTWALAPADLPT